MNRDRMRKISPLGLLVIAVAAFAYFGLVRTQQRHETAVGQAESGKDVYYCPMHKTHHSDKPGNCPICSMKLVKLEKGDAPVGDAMKMEPSATTPAAAPTSQTAHNAIFVPPEKQQLIGLRSVPAEMGTLTKDIRIVGKVSYDETHLTHIHSKVSGYIERFSPIPLASRFVPVNPCSRSTARTWSPRNKTICSRSNHATCCGQALSPPLRRARRT